MITWLLKDKVMGVFSYDFQNHGHDKIINEQGILLQVNIQCYIPGNAHKLNNAKYWCDRIWYLTPDACVRVDQS